MANVTVNGTNYTGVNEVRLPITNGGGSEQSFVLPPSGTKSITANGNGIDVASYAAVNVNVPTGITPTGTRNITANGTYDVTQYASANVNVSGGTTTLQQKSVTAPASGTTSVTPDSGYDGLSKVTVSPTPTETKSITANGTYTPTSGKHFSQVTVNVSGDTPQTQEKTVTPTMAGLVVTPDSGKLLSKVTVNGDADLVAGNIKNGVNIFGVTGTYSGGGSTVQTYTGTFTANEYGVATLNCGFCPDIVFIDLGTHTEEGYTYYASICLPLFADRTNIVESIAWGNPVDLNAQYYVIAYSQTSTGCTIQQYQVTDNWGIVSIQGLANTPYTAYKFL